jgi:glycine betaine/proline transport system substrate-binding protein
VQRHQLYTESGMPSDNLNNFVMRDIEEEIRKLAKMLKAFKLDDKQIGDIESLINGGLEPEAAAKKWIGENKDLVDSWMK